MDLLLDVVPMEYDRLGILDAVKKWVSLDKTLSYKDGDVIQTLNGESVLIGRVEKIIFEFVASYTTPSGMSFSHGDCTTAIDVLRFTKNYSQSSARRLIHMAGFLRSDFRLPLYVIQGRVYELGKDKFGQDVLFGVTETYCRREYDKDWRSRAILLDDITYEPDHISPQRIVNNCFNNYKPLPQSPADGVIGSDDPRIRSTMSMLRHVFSGNTLSGRSNFDLALEYLWVMYHHPKRHLPILTLVSGLRKTGKSTFGNWLGDIYGNNVAFVSNDAFSSKFHGAFKDKTLIIGEEIKMSDEQTVNTIKNLSTSYRMSYNLKGRDEFEGNFYGNFILMSNHVEDFARIDREENRFWVVPVGRISGKSDDGIRERLRGEIPYFLAYLRGLSYADPGGRMWFDERDYATGAEQVVKSNSLTVDEEKVADVLDMYAKSRMDSQKLYIDYQFLSNTALKNTRTTRRMFLKVAKALFDQDGGQLVRLGAGVRDIDTPIEELGGGVMPDPLKEPHAYMVWATSPAKKIKKNIAVIVVDQNPYYGMHLDAGMDAVNLDQDEANEVPF